MLPVRANIGPLGLIEKYQLRARKHDWSAWVPLDFPPLDGLVEAICPAARGQLRNLRLAALGRFGLEPPNMQLGGAEGPTK